VYFCVYLLQKLTKCTAFIYKLTFCFRSSVGLLIILTCLCSVESSIFIYITHLYSGEMPVLFYSSHSEMGLSSSILWDWTRSICDALCISPAFIFKQAMCSSHFWRLAFELGVPGKIYIYILQVYNLFSKQI